MKTFLERNILLWFPRVEPYIIPRGFAIGVALMTSQTHVVTAQRGLNEIKYGTAISLSALMLDNTRSSTHLKTNNNKVCAIQTDMNGLTCMT